MTLFVSYLFPVSISASCLLLLPIVDCVQYIRFVACVKEELRNIQLLMLMSYIIFLPGEYTYRGIKLIIVIIYLLLIYLLIYFWPR